MKKPARPTAKPTAPATFAVASHGSHDRGTRTSLEVFSTDCVGT